ncbi:oxidoreductase [Actinoplanes cyaneus]|uniref:Oxidoreductase n=1 Tax=Actinoplanes cyaneus TaxID=52696 RepID=A0A919IV84_9ACTN|nr:oxidoreductase [Actinoplanes cyaneus]
MSIGLLAFATAAATNGFAGAPAAASPGAPQGTATRTSNSPGAAAARTFPGAAAARTFPGAAAARAGTSAGVTALTWRLSTTGSTAQFRGLAAVSDSVAWVAGSAGTILRTVDGGRNWSSVGPADAATLEFRDIEAFDARHAVALTIGSGTDSRIYTTADAGRTWTRTFQNEDAAAFYDCMTFLDRRHGLALSDPVGGKFRILATRDGGRSWSVLPDGGMPAALDGEFAFAASGTCLVSTHGQAFFATGGGAAARVFSSRDFGHSWRVTSTPIPSGPTAGIYGLAFRDPGHGLAVGGDYTTPASAPAGSAVTRDGRTWTVSRVVPGEYRSGVAWSGRTAVTVGPTGSDVSSDGGRTWRRFDTGSFDAVACASHTCWASGVNGRVARLSHH